ncbi:MAG: 50S ribosomal protein L28 [Anaerolineae bacterium]
MAKCERCGKGPQFGKNRPFSLKATNRRYNVNVQRVTIQEGGRSKSVRLCTRCIRTLSKS